MPLARPVSQQPQYGDRLGDVGYWGPYVNEVLSRHALPHAGASVDSAAELGAALAALHGLPVPPVVARRDLLPGLRAGAAARLETFGLPSHLVTQVAAYLADAPRDRVLVHADVTADHVFVERGRLAGIIDWGDAIAADPWYELVAVRFDALHGDETLFAAFLDGYGWPRTDDFGRRFLQAVLEFQFNAVAALARRVDLRRIGGLDELAARLGPS